MDMARHTVGAPLPRHLPVFVQNEADAAILTILVSPMSAL